MSAKRLKIWIRRCLYGLILYAGFYVYAAFYAETLAEILKTLIPLVLAFAAAFLAAGFNRRNSYLQAMRDLWQRLIPAVQAAIQYTHLAPPDQSDFARTQEALSTAIDELRGVFANVPTRTPTGLYPYENLKDIREVISWLGYGKRFRLADAARARLCITRLWQEMHTAMLGEFDRDVPMAPVSKYFGTEKKSVADLLIEGSLADDDLSLGRLASRSRRVKRNGISYCHREDRNRLLGILP